MQRTIQQNKSIHLYLTLLSKELNDAGLDMKKVLKPSVSIDWNLINAKEYLWKPIQKALIFKESSADLESNEVTQVWETLNRHLGDKFGIYVPFPNQEQTQEYYKSLEKSNENITKRTS